MFTTNANIDLSTGIHYGIVLGNHLDADITQELMFGSQAYDREHEQFLQAKANELGLGIDDLPDDVSDDYQNDEPYIEGVYEGVQYATSWLGGALYFFILGSPVVSGLRLCSPCVPNGHDIRPCDKVMPVAEADLDEHGYGYTVPTDWFAETAVADCQGGE